jgi:hypothetical protein
MGEPENDVCIDEEWGRHVREQWPHMDQRVVEQIVTHSENNEPLNAQELQALVCIMVAAPHMCASSDGVLGDVLDLLNCTLGSSDGKDVHALALMKPHVQALFHANPERFRAAYEQRLQMHVDGPEALEWADRFWALLELPWPREPA